MEVQEPADLGVLAEWRGFVDSPMAATGRLEPAVAMSCFRIEPQTRGDALAAAFQRPRTVREVGGNQEIALLERDALPFFEARRMEVASGHEPDDGRYYVGVVVDGGGWIQGPGWREPVRRGDTFACAAGLAHRFTAEGPLRVIRAFGPHN